LVLGSQLASHISLTDAALSYFPQKATLALNYPRRRLLRRLPRKDPVNRSVIRTGDEIDKAHIRVARGEEHRVKEMRMSAVYEVIESEVERVERWRVEELMRAGYDPLAAGRIALRSDIDLHQAIGLLVHGCPVDLAVRILL